MKKSADFSQDRIYRYALWRIWGGINGYVNFIGLNPSTADEVDDDRTISKCIYYAKEWGYSGFCMTNLFAFRSTDPDKMKIQDDPVGPDNDDWLKDVANMAAIRIAAWGNHGEFMFRYKSVKSLVRDLHYLRLTKKNQPEHPLYLPKTLRPTQWI